VRAWDKHPIQNRRGETTTGFGLAGVVQYMLVDAARAAEIPLVVTRAARGDYTALNRNIPQGAQAGSGSLNLEFYSIRCNEPWVGLNVRGPWHTDFDTNEQAQLAYDRSICVYVPKRTEPASAWTLPHSKTPLLLLAGGADPQDSITNMPHLSKRSRTVVRLSSPTTATPSASTAASAGSSHASSTVEAQPLSTPAARGRSDGQSSRPDDR
jgi:hypothetical protein